MIFCPEGSWSERTIYLTTSESAVTHVYKPAYLPKVLEVKHPNSCHWLHTQQQTLIAATVEA